MLSDLLTHLTTHCSPLVRKLGYLNEAIEMRRRHRLHRGSWQPHLDNTRQFVLNAAEQCRDRSTVVVLGSGLLLDVPLPEVSAMFRDVVLMDVVCLPEVRRRIKAYGNVRFIERDVTGIAESLFGNKLRGVPELPDAQPLVSGVSDHAGLVVSLNILSQLTIIPRAFAARHLRGFSPYELDDWCARTVETHYASLRSLRGDVCLIADYDCVRRDRAGKVVSAGSTIYGLKLPKPDASWTWSIAPIRERAHYLSKELLVGAWHLRHDRH